MKIIISPAKRMNSDAIYLEACHQPVYIKESEVLLKIIQTFDCEQLKYILETNDTIALNAYHDFHKMNLALKGTPALLSYDGIQYSSMAPHVFTDEQLQYVDEHVRILSGFYGILRPLDEVHPYRLELNNRFNYASWKSLYAFWNDKPYQMLVKEDTVILDLASVQYSKIIKKYLQPDIQMIKCYFMEETSEGFKEKGVYVKIARGEMVRYLAEKQVESLDSVKKFNRLGYRFHEELSNNDHYVFTRSQSFKISMNDFEKPLV